MNVPKRNALKICRQCGAECAPLARRCWLCDAELLRESDLVLAETVDKVPGHAPSEAFFAIATLFVLAAVVLIGIGLGAQAPGLAFVYAVLTLPALIGSCVRIKIREASDGSVSWYGRFVTLVMSGAITLGVLGLLFAALIAALIAALFMFCSGAMH